MIGTTLSHYKVLEKIGQGGMGEVYRAEDTNLSREVAIKVLPEQFTKDPQRLARFEREAKLLASLNHPNIAAIHSFEHSDDIHFLVLELVEGETLAERVAKGPFPVEEALEVCLQIAEGVEAAHEKGVIHRDLKPANVKITPEGQVKILDFGLAKAFEGEAPITDISQSPTLTEEMTRAGVILGTAAYMSPEQAKGRPVDKRADIFAFGCVLYELLTGKRAFQGETITETLGAIIHKEPDWEILPENTPWNIRTLLRRSVQKDPGDRLKDIGDARLEIKEYLTDPTADATVEAVQAAPPHPGWQRWLPWALAAILAGSTLYTAFWSQPALPETPVRKFELLVPSQGSERRPPQISPDGTKIVYFSEGQLWIRELDQWQPRPLDGTQDASFPCWSPDSTLVAYLAEGRLLKVPISGGEPQVVAAVNQQLGGNATCTWEPNGRILIAGTSDFGLLAVSSQGGDPQEVLPRSEGEADFHEVSQLPGGAVLFSTHEGSIQYFDGSTRKEVLKLENEYFAWPIYSESGHLVYYRGTTNPGIWAVPFSVSGQEITGQPFLVVPGAAYPSLSKEGPGTLVYLPGGESQESSLVWVDRQGAVEPLGAPPHPYREPRLSPDGGRVAVRIQEASPDIWIYDIARQTLTRLTFEGVNALPLWTPDGQRVTWRSTREGVPGSLFWKLADGTGAAERLTTSEFRQYPGSWSPDGQFLAFYQRPSAEASPNARDIWILPLEGERKPQSILQTQFNELSPVFSPDGRWLAYVSDESGRTEIYVRPFPQVEEGKWQISTDGGVEPRWAPNGGELFYRSETGDQMMVVDITTEPTFQAGAPRLLFEGSYRRSGLGSAAYDVTPDGQRFLMVQAVQETGAGQIQVVLNWFKELKRLAPTN